MGTLVGAALGASVGGTGVGLGSCQVAPPLPILIFDDSTSRPELSRAFA